MGRPRNWLNSVKGKFQRTSQRAITILHSPSPIGDARFAREVQAARAICGEEDNHGSVSSILSSSQKRELTREDISAIKIQANFRGHLARRAFRALRSLVKLQALVRGVCVRRQARIALHCMHALVRLQVRVRARQLLGRCSDD